MTENNSLVDQLQNMIRTIITVGALSLFSGCHAQPDFSLEKQEVLCENSGKISVSREDTNYIAEIGGSDWRVVFHSVKDAKGGNSKYLVNFEGGPKAVSADRRIRKRLETYMAGPSDKTSIFTVELSTSGSPKSSKLLSTYGLSAFDCDAKLVSTLLNEIKLAEPDASVIFMATSFSGLLAMKLYAQNDVDGLILLVPWINFVDSKYVANLGKSSIVAGRPINTTTPEFREFYHNYFKKYMKIDETQKTDPGRQWMADARDMFAQAENLENVMVIQVEHENRYDKDKAAKYFSSIGVGCVIEIESLIHEAVTAHPKTISSIQQFLANGTCQ
ncbi:MAG: hypothetical protein AAF296_11135 [Pseudomonadota bacterium]